MLNIRFKSGAHYDAINLNFLLSFKLNFKLFHYKYAPHSWLVITIECEKSRQLASDITAGWVTIEILVGIRLKKVINYYE